jgi:GntR family transcriptional repressor for pyruvate dehydrogenase complex
MQVNMLETQSSLSLEKPVQQQSVVSLVIERIKEALVNKELKPGDFLPSETELVKNLGVGKTTVREAVKMLQAMGIVEVRRGQGTVIRQHPGEDFIHSMIFHLLLESGTPKDIVALRRMFEPAYTLMAMEQATEEDIERIRETVESFEEKIEKGEQRAEDDLAFHHAILQSTHNPFVIKIGETILQLFKASITRSMEFIPKTALRDHQNIFAAFCEKDKTKLEEAIITSFEGWKQSLYTPKTE